MPNPTEEQIRIRAHQLWEAAGQPMGRDQEFWDAAEGELKGDVTSNPDEKTQTFLE